MSESKSHPAPISYDHVAFGLNLRSCLALPELLPAAPGATPDIEIVYADVPAELEGALKRGVRFQAARDKLLLIVDGVARYLVENGRRVSIAREPNAEDEDVRLYLLGSALGALLHQRDDLVLHGSAIEWDGEALVFLGFSGAGKSTLATAFRHRGHAVLTDDLCVMRPDANGRLLAYPGFPQTKLWIDSLRQLQLAPDGLRRVRRQIEKRAVALGTDFVTRPLRVKKFFLLRPLNQDELKLVQLGGPRKFSILKNHTYRFGFLAAGDDRAGHFQHALRLSQETPVAVAVRPSGSFRLKDLVDLIESDVRALSPSGA